MARVCKSKLPQTENVPDNREINSMSTGQIDTQSDEESDDGVFFINTINQKGRMPITVCIEINDKGVQMEVDTGAFITIMSENTYKALWPITNSKEVPRENRIKVKTYTGQQIQVRGSKVVQVQYGNQAKISVTVGSG